MAKRVKFKLATLTRRCLHIAGLLATCPLVFFESPAFRFGVDLIGVACDALKVRSTRLANVGDSVFLVVAAKLWNELLVAQCMIVFHRLMKTFSFSQLNSGFIYIALCSSARRILLSQFTNIYINIIIMAIAFCACQIPHNIQCSNSTAMPRIQSTQVLHLDSVVKHNVRQSLNQLIAVLRTVELINMQTFRVHSPGDFIPAGCATSMTTLFKLNR
jgi:hypothetical protein